MKRFTELMNPGAKFDDTDPTTAKTKTTAPAPAATTTSTAVTTTTTTTDDPVEAEYGGNEKIKYYKDGVPENIGRKTVDELFKGAILIALVAVSGL